MCDDEDLKEIRNRLSRMEDRVEHVTQPGVNHNSAQLDEQDQRINELEAQVAALQERLDDVIDVDEPDDSTPESRAVALREAMIRAAKNRAGSNRGVTWWWQEVEDQLSSHGHGGFSKPTYHQAMDDATEKGGFTETTKEVVTGGQRREVKAIQLDPSNITSPNLRNQLTTRDGPADGTEAATTDGGAVKTTQTR